MDCAGGLLCILDFVDIFNLLEEFIDIDIALTLLNEGAEGVHVDAPCGGKPLAGD